MLQGLRGRLHCVLRRAALGQHVLALAGADHALVRSLLRDFVSQQVQLETTTTLGCSVQSYRQAAVQGYINNDVFFSQEGVFMHQMMDCIFMGPYTKVNYWPGDSQGRLSVPAWYRDLNGLSMLLGSASRTGATGSLLPSTRRTRLQQGPGGPQRVDALPGLGQPADSLQLALTTQLDSNQFTKKLRYMTRHILQP